jgi:putative SOS response-associated peptidase YedK
MGLIAADFHPADEDPQLTVSEKMQGFSETLSSSKNAKVMVLTLFKHCRKPLDRTVDLIQIQAMCGRYRRTTSQEELARRYKIALPTERDLPISWNIAPTQDVLTIRYNPETKQRTLDNLRWGLIPSWSKDPKIAYKTVNARAESVDTAPSYRQAFKKRRCLIPSDGFYEWKKVPDGKIPYTICMEDDSPFVFAGLWEDWKDPEKEVRLHTCTIITGEPNEFVREIHNRMPVILPEERHEAWLSGEAGKDILIPFPADRMKAWPISPRVNKPQNNDSEIVLPVELASMSWPEKTLELF